jgi:hypothetical protein
MRKKKLLEFTAGPDSGHMSISVRMFGFPRGRRALRAEN